MLCVKKWQQRSAVIIALGLLGTLAFGLRTALLSDKNTAGNPASLPCPEARESTLHVSYTWDLTQSPTYTIVTGDNPRDLLAEAAHTIDIRFDQGRLVLTPTQTRIRAKNGLSQIESRFEIVPCGAMQARVPSGKKHTLRFFRLSCEAAVTPPFWQRPRRTLGYQFLMIDSAAETADIVPISDLIPQAKGYPFVISTVPTGLPERYEGNSCDRDLTRLLYRLADIENPTSPPIAEVVRDAEEIVSLYANPNQPWPDCWGTSAYTARRIGALIVPTLQYWQENNCFGSQELAKAVSSPVFSRIFGKELLQTEEASPTSSLPDGKRQKPEESP